MASRNFCTLEFKHRNGLDEDSQLVSFAVRDDGPVPASPAVLHAGVRESVEDMLTAVSGVLSLDQYLSPIFPRDSTHVLRIYDVTDHLNGEPHGSPLVEGPFTLTNNAQAGALPAEVTTKVTLRAFDWDIQPIERPDGADEGLEVDRPRSRYTGGFYLPSLSSNASFDTVAGSSRPHPDFRTTCLQAVDTLAISLAATLGATLGLAVWSRKDAAMRLADIASIDDAWDTQRRRGEARTVRTSVSLG